MFQYILNMGGDDGCDQFFRFVLGVAFGDKPVQSLSGFRGIIFFQLVVNDV